MLNSWFDYQNDLNAMTDEEVAEETRRMEGQAVEAEAWLKAVVAWDAAGRPRPLEPVPPSLAQQEPPMSEQTPCDDLVERLRERVAELEAAKWEVKHIDTMNDLAAMGVARDVAEARALAAEAEVARLTAEREKDQEAAAATYAAMLSAAPPAPTREEVARIIDPVVGCDRSDVPGLRHEEALDEREADAYAKADAILSLLGRRS